MGFGAVLFAAMDALSDADKKDREAAIVKLGDTIELQISPAGMIESFGGTSAPAGYLECDGAAVSRTGEATLFAAIGTTWGVGDGSTTFNVPDLPGTTLRGAGSHGSETMADGNPYAGPAVGAFEDDQMQGHTHPYANIRTGGTVTYSPTLIVTDGRDNDSGNVASTRNAATSLVETDPNGVPRTGDETKPFTAGVLWCIKT